MDAAKPSCPSADPRSLQAAGHVRYSASTASPRHPGQPTSPGAHGPVAGRWGSGAGAYPPTSRQGAQHPTPSQPQDRDLEATLGGPLRLAHPRPPTLPFWAAALPRWASLNSPIAYLDRWTRNPATHLPSFFRFSFDPHVPRTTTASLRNPSSPSLSPADLSSSLTYSLARSLTSWNASTSSCSSLPATSLDPPCKERPAAAQTRPVPTIAARHPRHTHTHPLCKADRPPSFARPPHEQIPFPLRTQTRTYYSENTEDKARPLPKEPSQPGS